MVVSLDSNGNAYVYGISNADFDSQASLGNGDVFLAKYNPSGDKLFTRIYGTADSDYEGGILTDDSNHFYLGGRTLGDLNGKKIAADRGMGLWQCTRRMGHTFRLN